MRVGLLVSSQSAQVRYLAKKFSMRISYAFVADYAKIGTLFMKLGWPTSHPIHSLILEFELLMSIIH